MKIANVAAGVLGLGFVAGIGLAMSHQQAPGAGLHVAIVLDVSGTSRPADRCAAAGTAIALALQDVSRARTIDAWVTGTRARSDGEPLHLATWSRPRTPRVVELEVDTDKSPDAAIAELVSRCEAEASASQSPLFAALAAALDGLRTAGCGRLGVACQAIFATDGIETQDASLMARQAGKDGGSPRLDNQGIAVILCGTAARVPVSRTPLPTRDQVEAAWRAELQVPALVEIHPVCSPNMRVDPPSEEFDHG